MKRLDCVQIRVEDRIRYCARDRVDRMWDRVWGLVEERTQDRVNRDNIWGRIQARVHDRVEKAQR